MNWKSAVLGILAISPCFAAGGDHSNTLLWKTINFVILVVVLGYGISKVAGKFFRSRTAEIQAGILEAQRQQREAMARAAEIDRRMEQLGAEIEELRSNAASEMKAEGARIEEETTRMAARLEDYADQEIAAALKQARKELRAHAADLALEMARERIRARLTPETEAGLVDAFSEQLARPKGGTH